MAKLLENRQRKEVATVVELSGRIENPSSSVFQVIGGLIENAFFQAILPGFDRASLECSVRLRLSRASRGWSDPCSDRPSLS